MKPMKHESRGKVRAKWPWLLGLAALLITAMLVLVMFKSAQSGRSKGLNPLARLLFRFNEGTRFAPGYSEKAFYSIKLGDDEATVTKLLGAPLLTWTNDTQILGLTHMGQALGGNPPQIFPNGPRTHWAYASGPMPAFSSKGRLEDEVDYTVFAFDGSGRVEEVFGQVVSAKQVGVLSAGATVSAGDGLNFLKLSNAQIAMLKGKGFAEIEASFGKPTAVRESQPLKMLSYSGDSPPGSSYRKRIIGINAEGKVAEIEDGYEFRD
jgi:hypothetical protein